MSVVPNTAQIRYVKGDENDSDPTAPTQDQGDVFTSNIFIDRSYKIIAKAYKVNMVASDSSSVKIIHIKI